MRQLIPSLRGAALVLALVPVLAADLGVGAVRAADAAETLTLSIADSRALAVQSLQDGKPGLTAALARGLLQRDPGDIDALMLLGWAEVALQHPDQARTAAVRAFALAKGNPRLRFAAARLAAKSAYEAGQLTRAGFWLRRASDAASSPEEQAEAVAGYRNITAQNRWANRFSFALAPSSNINGGSQDQRLTIDGQPTGALLSPDALALSGLEATLDVSTSYRIASGPQHLTSLGLRAFGATYALSDAARRLTEATGTKGSDFAFGALEVSLRQQRQAAGNGQWNYGLTAGKTWYGGSPMSRYGRLDLARSFALGAAAQAQVSGALEQGYSERDDSRTLLASLQGQVVRRLAGGGTLALVLGVSGTDSTSRRAEYRSINAAVSYALGQPVGPAEVTLGLAAAARHYPQTFTGSLFGDGPRQDNRLTATVEMVLPQAAVMGFAPSITFSAGHNWSNVSRFEQQDIGVAFGLKSTF
ncbi:tetratricopeptide repeat protein [Rhodobacter ferrooxidans]|uniref:DUF560 domain-containing protein n=1 Tax=Rhodobacter ferrooxidans TaxID=371731 RepID=C8RZQ9_9RHOB|nr:hypothetical protein [Rhodobacter sp. SW2]EEW25856.1 conserved hypothetical protein [Rhodobacter sp. SW2]